MKKLKSFHEYRIQEERNRNGRMYSPEILSRETERYVNKKMDRLNYEKRPIFSGTERIRGHYERREWVQNNLLPEGQDIIRYIQSNIWMSEHENGGIGWREINSKTTTPDILKAIGGGESNDKKTAEKADLIKRHKEEEDEGMKDRRKRNLMHQKVEADKNNPRK